MPSLNIYMHIYKTICKMFEINSDDLLYMWKTTGKFAYLEFK